MKLECFPRYFNRNYGSSCGKHFLTKLGGLLSYFEGKKCKLFTWLSTLNLHLAMANLDSKVRLIRLKPLRFFEFSTFRYSLIIIINSN